MVGGLLFVGIATASPEHGLSQRMRAAVEATRNLEVVYTDPLGEGEGLDSDPRTPSNAVDCMTWVQWVLALALGPENAAAERMDDLRYYGGRVTFRTRKHYLDRWLAWDPGPLVPVSLPAGLSPRTHSVQLQPTQFRQHHGAPCPLWREKENQFAVPYLTAGALLTLATRLSPGWYVLTGIASDRYLNLYGGDVGTMGQVHLFLLDATGTDTGRGDPRSWTLWHASVRSGRVVEDQLGRLLDHTQTIYEGFVPYRVTDDWQPLPGVALGPCPPGHP